MTKMKLEYGIVAAVGILICVSLALIANDPNEIVAFSSLEKINQKAQEAKKSENQNSFDEYRSKMKKQLESVTSSVLGIDIDSIYLKDNWNLPFQDSSKVKHTMEEYKKTPICNILPNLSLHLQNIRQTELFLMYCEKYRDYHLELDIADERYYNSTVHYGFSAKSGNKHASTFFHVDSCSGKVSEYFFLRCHDPVIKNSTSSNYPSEVFASLKNDEFCEIHLIPWREELKDYNELILSDVKMHLEKMQKQDGNLSEEMIPLLKELDRLDLLGDMVRLLMQHNFDEIEFSKKMEQYERQYGIAPDDFVELIAKRK